MFFLSNNEENYLTEQIESLNSKLNSIDEIRQQIESQNMELYNELESFKSESISSNLLPQPITSIAEIDAIKLERDDLLFELNDLKKNFDYFLSLEKNKMQEIINELEENIKDLFSTQNQVEINLAKFKEEKLQLENELHLERNEKQEVIIQLKHEMEIRKQLVDKYENDKIKVKKELNDYKSKHDIQVKQISDLKNQLNELINEQTTMDTEDSKSDSLSKDSVQGATAVAVSSNPGSIGSSKANRKKFKKNYLTGLETQIESLNNEIISLKNLISIYKTDNESLKQQIVDLKSSDQIQIITSQVITAPKVSASSKNTTNNKELDIVKKKASQLESANLELSKQLFDLTEQTKKETLIQTDLIHSLRALNTKLETDHTASIKAYENLIKSQKQLITKLEQRYNDVLNYLYDEMMEGAGDNQNKYDDIQNDLNSLLLNQEQSTVSYSDKVDEDGYIDDSLAEDDLSIFANDMLNTNSRKLDNLVQIKELIKHFTSQTKCKCLENELNFDSETYFANFLKENLKQEEIQNEYFSQVTNFKDLLNAYLKQLADKETKLNNLKKAYQKLHILYESTKQQSISTYNNLHREYLNLIKAKNNNSYNNNASL
jgi:hypothetical protein